MKTLVLLGVFIGAALAVPVEDYETGVPAETCNSTVCLIEDGCRCASPRSPLADVSQGPQLISLTFDEAVTEDLYNSYWEPLLFNRVNPDGRPIGATFFVSHEYTDYSKVNYLYNHGFEIGVHSITNSAMQDYWRNASEALLEQEFGGQREIISKFANIPIEDIIGARTPQLQYAGNLSFEAYVASGLKYDSSWPTQPGLPLFPYTLNYKTIQDCNLGTECPNEAFEGFWVLPIIDIYGPDYNVCNVLATCIISGTSEEIAEWLIGEVNRIRTGTKAPLTLLVSSIWFYIVDNSLEAFSLFLDKLTEYDDVFLVTQKQVLDWIQNPVPVSQFQTEEPVRNAECDPQNCVLTNVDNATRYMISCVTCPKVYPWLGNPDGDIV